ncbi:MAG: 8-oxoguanine deaminase [Spirochaetales bacterium]|nr:8-oxoguanine deaminase [Spirochaetales bacterium]
MKSILIRNCSSIFQSAAKGVLKDHDLLIQGNVITRIAPNIDVEADRIIDGRNRVVIPGLVNSHHHFYQTFTRNLPAVQNAELFEWLVYLYEIWKHLDIDSVYNSSLLAMGELLKTGCTTATDHHYLYPQDIDGDIMATQFAASDALGMRFSPTRGSMSLSKKDGGLPPDTVVQDETTILKDSERVIKAYHDSSDFSMKKIVLAPCSPFSVTEGLMKDSAALAREYGVRLHTHLAETRDENDFCLKVYGRRPVQVMADCDFLGEDVFFAHGIHFNDEELEILAETGSHIAHCPTSNMRLGSGICRVTEMIPKNINVGLAVDGSASNDSSDMLGEVRNALMLQRVQYGAAAVSMADVLKLGTENGARLLGYDKVGRLEEGLAADLAIFNMDKLEYAGALSDPVAALIFSGYNHEAEYTIVNGHVAVDKGKLTGVDEEELKESCMRLSAALWKKGGVQI